MFAVKFLLTFMHRRRMSALVLDLLLVIKEARTKRRHGKAKLISLEKKDMVISGVWPVSQILTVLTPLRIILLV